MICKLMEEIEMRIETSSLTEGGIAVNCRIAKRASAVIEELPSHSICIFRPDHLLHLCQAEENQLICSIFTPPGFRLYQFEFLHEPELGRTGGRQMFRLMQKSYRRCFGLRTEEYSSQLGQSILYKHLGYLSFRRSDHLDF